MKSRGYHKCVKQARKICKYRVNVEFMENCITEKVVELVQKEVMNKTRLQKNQVRSLRFRKRLFFIKSVKKTQQKHTSPKISIPQKRCHFIR